MIDLKMEAANRITKVAVVGVGGNVGSFITQSLLATGKHFVTAITRDGSQANLPDEVTVKKVDYAQLETLVEALKGQDALVITLSGFAPQETEFQLIRAAGQAGVPWILPNEWGPDSANEALVSDVPAFKPKVDIRKEIEKLGKSSYVAVSTGYWYEWSLAKPLAYGFDFVQHTATFFDEGETKVSTSTWPQVGRAVAALLSLPIKPEDPTTSNCLQSLKNKVVYIHSFTVSQSEMLESITRVTGTTKDHWSITKEPSRERYAAGVQEVENDNYTGLSKMGCRVFFPDGCGDFETNKGTLNEMLSLPKENIDEATKIAMVRALASSK